MLTTRFSACNYKRLLPFLDAVDNTPDRHFKFTSEGYEPLSLEFLEYNFRGCPVYSMMHTYVQNGDLMRDPDMTFYVDRENGHIIPMSFQQDNCPFTKYGVLYQEVFDGENRWNPKLCHELDSFLNQWSKNILAQGFDPKQANESSVTPEEFAASISE